MRYRALLISALVAMVTADLKESVHHRTLKAKEVADPETTTPNGCTCESVCGASADDLFYSDWCNVAEDDCGEFSLIRGQWDSCLYKDSSRTDYLPLTWQEKQAIIWDLVKADASLGGYYPQNAFIESVMTSFENEWDFMPAGRKKAIHGVGSVCPIDVDIAAESPYSGLFKAGGKISGLIRMGAAADPFTLPYLGLTPGVGLKFLRSGVSSANVLLLNGLIPIPDDGFNFFQVPLYNHISEETDSVATDLLAKKFCQTGHCITKVGISNFCTHDQDGTEYGGGDLQFPFKIALEPSEVSLASDRPGSQEEFMSRFSDIPVGAKLYTLKAFADPEDSEGLVLGDVITTDQCITSNYGDTRLFFKHQWIDDDLALRPEWSDAYLSHCGCS